MTADPSPAVPSPQGEAPGPRPAYFGIGCVTAISGFFGGGMIAVLIAKIVGAAMHCAPEAETGAPCNWFMYFVAGAIVGIVVFPTVALLLARRGWRRRAANDSERTSKRG